MIAYLDNSATTRPTEGVIEAMVRAMREGYFNPSSVYQPAVEAFRSVRACREAVLEKLGAVGEKLVYALIAFRNAVFLRFSLGESVIHIGDCYDVCEAYPAYGLKMTHAYVAHTDDGGVDFSHNHFNLSSVYPKPFCMVKLYFILISKITFDMKIKKWYNVVGGDEDAKDAHHKQRASGRNSRVT